MDISGGYGWSSGSESGWTGYLDESNYNNPIRNDECYNNNDYNYSSHDQSYDVVVEEDLSMVSDASSGPQHMQQANGGGRGGGGEENCYSPSAAVQVKLSKYSGKKSKKSSGGKEHKLSSSSSNKHQSQQHSYSSSINHLDDTASSPAFTYSKVFEHPSYNQPSVDNCISFPQGYSNTNFHESSSYTNQYGFWQPTIPEDTQPSS